MLVSKLRRFGCCCLPPPKTRKELREEMEKKKAADEILKVGTTTSEVEESEKSPKKKKKGKDKEKSDKESGSEKENEKDKKKTDKNKDSEKDKKDGKDGDKSKKDSEKDKKDKDGKSKGKGKDKDGKGSASETEDDKDKTKKKGKKSKKKDGKDSETEKEKEIDDEKEKEAKEKAAKEFVVVHGGITKLQALVRRQLAYIKVEAKKDEIQGLADQYWLEIYRQHEEEKRRKAAREAARKMFVLQYSSDVVGTAMLYVIELSEAALSVQRTWRGHWCRMNLPKKPVPRKRIPKKYVPKQRYSAEILRRVWARTAFEPQGDGKGGPGGRTGYLHNTDFGYLEYDIFEHIDHPPRGRETVGLVTRKLRLPIKNGRDEFIAMHDRHAWVGLPVGYEDRAERSEREAAIVSQQRKNLYAISPYNVPLMSDEARESLKKKKKQRETPKVRYDAQGQIIESSLVDVLQDFGYDDRIEQIYRLPGMPRIGTRVYDEQTGHLLEYKGHSRWIRVSDGLDVHIPDKLAAERLSLHSLGAPSLLGESDDGSLFVRPTITEMKSGAIAVHNPNMERDSAFMQKHQKNFDKSFGSSDLLGQSVVEEDDQTNRDSLGESDDDEEGFRALRRAARGLVDGGESQLTGWSAVSKTLNTQRTRDGVPLRGKKVATLSLALRAKAAEREKTASTLDLSRFMAPPGTDSSLVSLSPSRAGRRGRRGTRSLSLSPERRGITWKEVRGGVSELGRRLATTSVEMQEQLLGRVGGDNSALDQLGLGDSVDLSTFGERDPGAVGALGESDYAEVWSRSLYRPRQPSLPRVVVWPRRKASEHYSLRYQWIPQPLVHNAVNNLYYARTYRDFRMDSLGRYLQEGDFHEEVARGLGASVVRETQNSLTQIVTGTEQPIEVGIEGDGQSIGAQSELTDERGLQYVYDDGSAGDSEGESVFDPDSTRHPLRAKPMDVAVLRKSKRLLRGKGYVQVTGDPTSAASVASSLTSDQASNIRPIGSIAGSVYPETSAQGATLRRGVNLEASAIEEEAKEDEEMLHDSGGLFLTSLSEGLHASPSAVLRGSPSRVALPPQRGSFEDFSRSTVPGKLVRKQVTLESTNEKVFHGKNELHRKFRFRPPAVKTTIGAKILPEDPPTHAYPFR